MDDAIRVDAERDGVPVAIARAVAITPIVGAAVLLAIYLVDRPAYYWVLREDHVVEWLQFAGLLFTVLLAAVTAWRLRARQRGVAVLLLLVAVGAFILAGEEISWAQRVFAYGAPADLAAMNQQAEVNVHNIEVAGLQLQSAFKLVSFIIAVTGFALAWLTRVTPRLRSSFWQAIAVPNYTMVGSATMIGFWAAVIVAPLHPVVRFQEWAEAGLYIALAATVYAIYRRISPADDMRDGGRGGHRIIVGLLLFALAVTAVFAGLTEWHGIIPMNARE